MKIEISEYKFIIDGNDISKNVSKDIEIEHVGKYTKVSLTLMPDILVMINGSDITKDNSQ